MDLAEDECQHSPRHLASTQWFTGLQMSSLQRTRVGSRWAIKKQSCISHGGGASVIVPQTVEQLVKVSTVVAFNGAVEQRTLEDMVRHIDRQIQKLHGSHASVDASVADQGETCWCGSKVSTRSTMTVCRWTAREIPRHQNCFVPNVTQNDSPRAP